MRIVTFSVQPWTCVKMLVAK